MAQVRNNAVQGFKCSCSNDKKQSVVVAIDQKESAVVALWLYGWGRIESNLTKQKCTLRKKSGHWRANKI